MVDGGHQIGAPECCSPGRTGCRGDAGRRVCRRSQAGASVMRLGQQEAAGAW